MRLTKLKELRELHKCANGLLHEYCDPMIHDHDKHYYSTLQHMSESILQMLDLCGATRDALLLAKEQLQELYSMARRTLLAGLDDDLEAHVSAHNRCRKKLKKEVDKCLRSLKDMCKHNKYVFVSDLSLIDSNLILVVHVLREVRLAALYIVDSLSALISTPVTTSGPSTVVLVDAGPLQELEVELVCIMRRLIHTRVLLLNLLTNSPS